MQQLNSEQETAGDGDKTRQVSETRPAQVRARRRKAAAGTSCHGLGPAELRHEEATG